MTATTLDELAARAVFTARLFERAVHDQGPWTMTWNRITVPVQRLRGATTVTLLGEFPEVDASPDARLTLRCGEDIVGVREIDTPADDSFTIRWIIEGSLVGAPA